jgi:protease-4
VKGRTWVVVIVVAGIVFVFGAMALLFVVGLVTEQDTEFAGFGSKVAIVDIVGTISASDDIVRQLRRWGDDGSVKAVVLRIDSPGGGVAASQEIYSEVLKLRDDGKTVVTSMGSVAASGGYYIACASDIIVANPGTLTGSIGTIISYPTAKELLDKIGVQWEIIKSGDLKASGTFTRPTTPEEERMLKAVIDDGYQQFVEAVAAGRGKDKEDIYPLADGSVFTGRQAVNFGLVDSLGTLQDAISIAGEMADLGPDPKTIKERPEKPTLIDLLLGRMDIFDKISESYLGGPQLEYLYQ